MKQEVTLFWFRRDLRLEDNVGLFAALKENVPVLPIFIFDTEILEKLPKNDARVNFIHQSLCKMHKYLKENFQSGISIYLGKPLDVFQNLQQTYQIKTVHTNHDYESYAKERDEQVSQFLKERNISFNSYKDQVVFEKSEIVKDDGTPYVVYTPYKNKWKSNFKGTHIKSHTSEDNLNNCIKNIDFKQLTLQEIGFTVSAIKVPEYIVSPNLIQNYEKTRDYPAIKNGTSRLAPHLRFGTVSVRKMVQKAIAEENEIFWNELIWREFFMQILWHFPHTINKAFRPKYDRIVWRNNEAEFKKWTQGQTGYALVDAGMRELNATGHIHNRVRMLVASFLCKHLLIDWRWGEAYFAEKLLDYELSSNIGNWQWAAGSGVDAAPYFRIFNPMTQVDKFDKQRAYINKWVPELQELTYPNKMVDHKMARERCLKTYKEAVG